ENGRQNRLLQWLRDAHATAPGHGASDLRVVAGVPPMSDPSDPYTTGPMIPPRPPPRPASASSPEPYSPAITASSRHWAGPRRPGRPARGAVPGPPGARVTPRRRGRAANGRAPAPAGGAGPGPRAACPVARRDEDRLAGLPDGYS